MNERKRRPKSARVAVLFSFAFVIFCFGGAPAQEPVPNTKNLVQVGAFGNVKIFENRKFLTYSMLISPSENSGGLIGIRCLTKKRGYIVELAPIDFTQLAKLPDPLTVTVWSDTRGPIDLYFRAPHHDMAVVADTEGVPEESILSTRRLMEILGSGKQFFAYSIGNFSVTFDAMHIRAATRRFAELCTSQPGITGMGR